VRNIAEQPMTITVGLQSVIDDVRVAITEPPHLAGEDTAGVLVMARLAFRTGAKHENLIDADEKADLIHDNLPAQIDERTGAKSVYGVSKRTFDKVMDNEVHKEQVLIAFDKGQQMNAVGEG
jgi:hypothetical protein